MVFIMRPDLGGVLRLLDTANLVRDAAGLAAETAGEGSRGLRGIGEGGGLVIAPRCLAIGTSLPATAAGKGLRL